MTNRKPAQPNRSMVPVHLIASLMLAALMLFFWPVVLIAIGDMVEKKDSPTATMIAVLLLLGGMSTATWYTLKYVRRSWRAASGNVNSEPSAAGTQSPLKHLPAQDDLADDSIQRVENQASDDLLKKAYTTMAVGLTLAVMTAAIKDAMTIAFGIVFVTMSVSGVMLICGWKARARERKQNARPNLLGEEEPEATPLLIGSVQHAQTRPPQPQPAAPKLASTWIAPAPAAQQQPPPLPSAKPSESKRTKSINSAIEMMFVMVGVIAWKLYWGNSTRSAIGLALAAMLITGVRITIAMSRDD